MPRAITAADRAAVAQNIRHTKIVDAGRKLARIVKTEHPSEESLKRRRRLEPHLEKWLLYYMPDTFCDKWGSVHLDCINRLQECINNGGCFALAMPRGDGKSAIGKGASIYATLTGRRSYIIPIGATDALAQSYLDFIKDQLDGSNELIATDYCEAIKFFKALDQKAIKGLHQLDEHGKRTKIAWRAHGITFPSVLKPDGKTFYPFSGARIECRGITAAMKGLSRVVSGRIIRPDFVLPDDVQTEDDAISKIACDKIESKIIGTVLALAGPRKRIACFMPCTVVQNGDVSSRFLDHKAHPEFQGKTHPMIVTWPAAQDTLWKKYAEIRREADDDKSGKYLATMFYKEHRIEMDAGASVSWESRVRDGEISALESAENLLIEYGPVKFAAEMQQEPIDTAEASYRLTSPQIQTHQAPWPRFTVPDRATIIVAATDINRARGGLHWVIVSFDQQMSGHVVVYGRWPESGEVWPENAPVGVRQTKLFAELTRLGQHIAILPLVRAGIRVRPSRLVVDRGYEPEVVHRFCTQGGAPFHLIPCHGYAAHKYGPRKASLVGAPKENCHVTTSSLGNFVAFNADAVREQMQRAWLGEAGTPGGATIYQSDPRQHVSFADHLCAEVLRQKYQTDYGMRYEWTHQPGSQWDWGDAMSMAYVGALEQGWTAQGVRVSAAPQRETRKCKVEAKRL